MDTTSEVNQGTMEQVPFGTIQHNPSNIMPASSEVGDLWASYFAENMAICMLKHIVAKSKDPDFKPIYQHTLDLTSRRVTSMEELFNAIHHPIPEGFGEQDVDANAPELFSETFNLCITRLMLNYIELKYSMHCLVVIELILDNFLQKASTCQGIWGKKSLISNWLKALS